MAMKFKHLFRSTENMMTQFYLQTKEANHKEQAHIYAMKIPHRMDKKKDRVEISIDQLLAAQDYAEKLSQKSNKEIRVLGWFHSHPHITVWPSHVGKQSYFNSSSNLRKKQYFPKIL